MSDAINGLKPALVWKYFAEISKIPRCSKQEEKIIRYVLETAGRLGLEAKRDTFGNVVVKKPASPGRGHIHRICLQGHLDMVCEKNKEKVHDFSKGPIVLVRKGNMLMADGTTLGADNGIAVATNLAIMEDQSLEHGPLEFLFTIDEETGLTGANNLQHGFVESRTLMNLDSEEEGSIYVGCSGGRDTLGIWKVECNSAPKSTTTCEVQVRGLKGGHSGLEIDKGRGNAIKIISRLLMRLEAIGSGLSAINGGNKRNAIPRESEAIVCIPTRKLGEAAALVEKFQAMVRAEFHGVEPDLSVTLQMLPRGKKVTVFRKAQQKKILLALASLPHGVLKMSADIPGLVETSTNVAVIATAKNRVELSTSQRSSMASELDEAVRTTVSILDLAGATVVNSDGYPGWKPNLESPILKHAKKTYRSLYGKDAEIKAIHAGLECGIIGEKYPGIDMVSFGPTLEGVHSPDEKIHIDTVERFWHFLLAILKNIQ